MYTAINLRDEVVLEGGPPAPKPVLSRVFISPLIGVKYPQLPI